MHVLNQALCTAKKLMMHEYGKWLKPGSFKELKQIVTECRLCPRIVKYRVEVASRSKKFSGEEYWSRGVPGFGDTEGKLLIVGLAPAATGANRTGRIFTGDKSSEFLVSCLYEAGITNQPDSTHINDGLEYSDAFVTAVVKCVPPMDKPLREEVKNCSDYFTFELENMKNLKAVLVLGRVAYDSVKRYLREKNTDTHSMNFSNGSYFDAGNLRIYTSYHPSPRNVNTKRILRDDFVHFLKQIRSFLDS